MSTPVREAALRYLGCGSKPPDDALLALLDDCEARLRQDCTPRHVWRLCSVTHTAAGVLLPECGLLLSGADIARHLQGCDRAVLLAATLSAGTDALLRRLHTEDMARAVVTDALASALLEEFLDTLGDALRAQLHPAFLTWRFSPGYGDLPLTLQADVLAALSAQKQIGLTVNAASMLLPQKSVTAIQGLSDTPQTAQPHGCAVCTLRERCGMRGSCGGKQTNGATLHPIHKPETNGGT